MSYPELHIFVSSANNLNFNVEEISYITNINKE